jgi:hypothetical protein
MSRNAGSATVLDVAGGHLARKRRRCSGAMRCRSVLLGRGARAVRVGVWIGDTYRPGATESVGVLRVGGLVSRGAGGRRKYNAIRQDKARLRHHAVLQFLAESRMSLLSRGTQRALAQRFSVSEATISRDTVGIYAPPEGRPNRCPFFGAKALDEAGIEAIEGRSEGCGGVAPDSRLKMTREYADR